MTQPFDRFVILARMRTGSNLLEATLNAQPGVECLGEAFNPHFIGWPKSEKILGTNKAERDAKPTAFLEKFGRNGKTLQGFRYFPDHDPRVFDSFMKDPRCAKIVLMRNPLDSYISTLLARQTDQWRVGKDSIPKPAKVKYSGEGFRAVLRETVEFLERTHTSLQTAGQTAFWLNYDDLRDPDRMAGLLRWLGKGDQDRVAPSDALIPQNPDSVMQKVTNPKAMIRDLANLDPFGLQHIPNFEPSRGAAIPSWSTCGAGRGLIFMPLRSGPEGSVIKWMSALGEVDHDYNRGHLNKWMSAHPGFHSFTVLRHPLLRGWRAYLQSIEPSREQFRTTLREVHEVPYPTEEDMASIDHQAVFPAFLGFLKRVTHGQTSFPVHPGWASQASVIAGFAQFASPSRILREEHARDELALIADQIGVEAPPYVPATDDIWSANDTGPVPEMMPIDAGIISRAREVWPRDYLLYGFSPDPRDV